MRRAPADGWGHLRWGGKLTASASIYTLVVAVIAAVGFVTDSTSTILLAALLGLLTAILRRSRRSLGVR